MENTAPTQRRLTLRKAEKLRHKCLVDSLFADGNSCAAFPLRAVWRRIDRQTLENSFRAGVPPLTGDLQMMITVPKKKLRHAVDRVQMRRRIREAYRLNRIPLMETVEALNADTDSPGCVLHIAFIYLHNEQLPYAVIEKSMKRILSKIQAGCEKS